MTGDDGRTRLATHMDSSDVVVPRASIAGVTFTRSSMFGNGRIVVTTADDSFRLNFHRSQQSAFETLARRARGHRLGVDAADPTGPGSGEYRGRSLVSHRAAAARARGFAICGWMPPQTAGPSCNAWVSSSVPPQPRTSSGYSRAPVRDTRDVSRRDLPAARLPEEDVCSRGPWRPTAGKSALALTTKARSCGRDRRCGALDPRNGCVTAWG